MPIGAGAIAIMGLASTALPVLGNLIGNKNQSNEIPVAIEEDNTLEYISVGLGVLVLLILAIVLIVRKK